jgi:phage terminase small subunit
MKKQKENSEAPEKKKKIRKKKPYVRTGYRLTKKQEDFCRVYIETGNASEAYRRVYNCERMKPETINRNAFDLIHHNKISAMIEKEQERLKRVVSIDKERLLYELKAITEASITDYLEFDGLILKFKDFSKLTDKQIRAIEGIKQTKDGFELKLHGKSWSLDRVCKILGYEAPKKIDHTTGGEKIQGDKIIILPSNDRQ